LGAQVLRAVRACAAKRRLPAQVDVKGVSWFHIWLDPKLARNYSADRMARDFAKKLRERERDKVSE
jgi:hypothetical protein